MNNVTAKVFCQWTLFLNGEARGSWQRGREIFRDDLTHCSWYRAGKWVSEAEVIPPLSHCCMHRSWEQSSGPVTVGPWSFCETWLSHGMTTDYWSVAGLDVLTVLLAPSTLDQGVEEGFAESLSGLEYLVPCHSGPSFPLGPSVTSMPDDVSQSKAW